MPSRNKIKQYLEGGYYHVYNRGIEQRDIFQDAQDYRVFLKYMRRVLISSSYISVSRFKNYANKVELISYCLMPNHFHFFIRQIGRDDMAAFMSSLMTAYAMYFNKRYGRTGRLYEDTYKAVLIETDEYFVHLSRYIHLNPVKLGIDPSSYPYSSLSQYLHCREDPLIRKEAVLQYFLDVAAFHTYTFAQENNDSGVLGSVTLD